jgi:hypothetical protein
VLSKLHLVSSRVHEHVSEPYRTPTTQKYASADTGHAGRGDEANEGGICKMCCLIGPCATLFRSCALTLGRAESAAAAAETPQIDGHCKIPSVMHAA